MVTFGFSAFLKLLSLNDRPQKTEIRKRLGPPSGGYNYHRSLRLHARRYLLTGESLGSVIASAETITRTSERQSAVAALERLAMWRDEHPGEMVTPPLIAFESPSHLFRVRFEPDFGLRLGGKTTAFHIWNTKRPRLAPGITYAALTAVAQAFEGQQGVPDDIGVLSMREPPAAYLLSDVPNQDMLAARVIARLEDIFRGSTPPAPQREDRPQP